MDDRVADLTAWEHCQLHLKRIGTALEMEENGVDEAGNST